MERYLQKMVETASCSGASGTFILNPKRLVVEDRLADCCLEPKCSNYGLSPSCPPHVEGPDVFRAWLNRALHALVIRIDVLSTVLNSEESREVMRLLHEIVAKVEMEAIHLKYSNSRGFAGGSCKKLFCDGHRACLRLSEKGTCRNPLQARPSMSGFGVDVGKMMEEAGWSGKMLAQAYEDKEKMSWVAGLVLVSR